MKDLKKGTNIEKINLSTKSHGTVGVAVTRRSPADHQINLLEFPHICVTFYSRLNILINLNTCSHMVDYIPMLKRFETKGQFQVA